MQLTCHLGSESFVAWQWGGGVLSLPPGHRTGPSKPLRLRSPVPYVGTSLPAVSECEFHLGLSPGPSPCVRVGGAFQLLPGSHPRLWQGLPWLHRPVWPVLQSLHTECPSICFQLLSFPSVMVCSLISLLLRVFISTFFNAILRDIGL